MNNIEKKLDALIDAMGFDVEETTIINGVVMSVRDATIIDRYCRAPKNTDYKLTKRKDPLDVRYYGIILRELTNNIIDINCDVTRAKKYKWIAYKIDAYNAVFDWFDRLLVINKGINSFNVLDVKVFLDE